jgi:hypothetical protein
MVDVIRVGLRLRTCVFADIAPELVWVWEDRVISSIQVGLVTGQEVAASLAHLFI